MVIKVDEADEKPVSAADAESNKAAAETSAEVKDKESAEENKGDTKDKKSNKVAEGSEVYEDKWDD